MMGIPLSKASQAPYLCTDFWCFSSFSRLTFSHFSIHSHLPSQPRP